MKTVTFVFIPNYYRRKRRKRSLNREIYERGRARILTEDREGNEGGRRSRHEFHEFSRTGNHHQKAEAEITVWILFLQELMEETEFRPREMRLDCAGRTLNARPHPGPLPRGGNRYERPTVFQRCGQPGQQHGRRLPSLSILRARSTCSFLVSTFFTEMVQQIHSLRASGVMSSQAASAALSEARAFRKSAGIWCTTPLEIAF